MVRFPSIRACLAALLLAGTLVHAPAATLVPLGNSICPVDATPPATGQVSPHHAYIVRQTLLASEAAAPMDFEVALKLHNFADLQARVAQGQRISPREMAAKYLPTAAEYTQVATWLTTQGYTITHRQGTRIAVFARGTVAQIQSGMHVTFARVSNGSAEFTSAITAPSVPAAVAPLLVGVNGLQPHIQFHKHSIVRKDSLTGTNPPYTPEQIAQAYNATPLYNSSITGAGQTIAIVIDTVPLTSDLTSFWSNTGINQSLSNVTLINVNDVNPLPTGTFTTEATLDTEWSSSIAPAAKVRVYAAGSLELAELDNCYAQVYDDATATPSLGLNQLSMSFGIAESEEYGNGTSPSSQWTTDVQYYTMLSSAGIGLFASSGDDGATPDGQLAVEMPASDPNITGVGGTSLTLTSSGSENTEVVWNNSSGATGGGISQYFNMPTWQTGTGVPSGAMRCVPDVSSSADPNNGAYFYLDGSAGEIGGTSWSSPTWAAFSALINQSRASIGLAPAGQLAPALYPYIGTGNFRDITSGYNQFKSRHGFTAGVGYDECTGIGVPNVAGIATALSPTSAPAFTNGPATGTGTISSAYSFTYTASGAPVPTFALATGSALPTGITLTSAGLLSGTPTQSGAFTGTVTASNEVGTVTQAYAIAIDQAPAFTNTPISATIGNASATTFTLQTSGYPAATYTLTSGTLPPGLTLSSSGQISGTATQAGTFTGLITATNGIGTDATQSFTITVVISTDMPTLPPWALALLGVAFVLVASRRPQRFI